jgi:hypothetical protein
MIKSRRRIFYVHVARMRNMRNGTKLDEHDEKRQPGRPRR